MTDFRLPDRLLLHLEAGLRRPVELSDVYFIEAVPGGTRLRGRSSDGLVDVRTLGELEGRFAPFGFLRVHRNYSVNLYRVLEIRRREQGQDWELKLEPPVNRVLPIARGRLQDVWRAFGD